MAEGYHAALLFTCATTWVVCALLVRKRLGGQLAILLAGVRVAIPLIFFASLDSGSWRALDDLYYFRSSEYLLSSGFTPLSLLVDPNGAELLVLLARGPHVGYTWINTLAHTLFGRHYWAPVFINVAASFLAVRFLWILLDHTGFTRRYARGVGVVFLLHWDLVAWSSFVNFKDIIAMTLTTGMLAGLVLFIDGRRLRAALLTLTCIVLITPIRTYLPLLFALAVGSWGLLSLSGPRRIAILVASISYGFFRFQGRILEYLHVDEAPVGLVHFLLSPRPWDISPSYTFLALPSILHWLLAPLAVWGGVRLWRTRPNARPVILYFLVLVAFYAVIPVVRGPRHRVQLSAPLVWFQVEGCLALYSAWRVSRGHMLNPPNSGQEPIPRS